MYSPALVPSRMRAHPAKKRMGSISCGISSLRVMPIGLPVFSHSSATNSSARCSNASAMCSSAMLRSLGVCVAPAAEGALRGAERRVDVRGARDRRPRELLAGRGVDQRRRLVGRRFAILDRRRSCAAFVSPQHSCLEILCQFTEVVDVPRTSSAECCTESVQFSSAPGAMSTPAVASGRARRRTRATCRSRRSRGSSEPAPCGR